MKSYESLGQRTEVCCGHSLTVMFGLSQHCTYPTVMVLLHPACMLIWSGGTVYEMLVIPVMWTVMST